ncbi:hypothetical protein TNCV_3007831 [Trichonephila clavipes]|nr:hypothetical protein TNCV_3007831 [Trichonephila clavipes]
MERGEGDPISSSIKSYNEYDIVNFIKIHRTKWVGQVVRMNEDHTTKIVFNAQPIGTRRRAGQILDGVDGLEMISQF